METTFDKAFPARLSKIVGELEKEVTPPVKDDPDDDRPPSCAFKERKSALKTLYRQREQIFAWIVQLLADRSDLGNITALADAELTELVRVANEFTIAWVEEEMREARRLSGRFPKSGLYRLLILYHKLGELILDLDDEIMEAEERTAL